MDKKVSVLIITYNHEKYITQAVESALQQEVSFPYEIVIGEDVSTDRTREIVLALQKKHPDRIRVMLRDAATSERDRARGFGGKTNFVQGLQDCRGEYVALLDGDDYWTDPHKLQKMLDFLESHPECSVAFHDAMMFYEGSEASRRFYPPDLKEIASLEDMLTTNGFPIPCTAMFRAKFLGKFPDCFDTVLNGDWMLFVLLAEHGNLGYINEVMAAYRVHEGGIWSRLDPTQGTRENIKTYETIDAYLNFRYTRAISEKIVSMRKALNQRQAQAFLAQYHRAVKNGEIRRGLRLLLRATLSAPLQVFRPRDFAAVLKNGFAGVFHKQKTQN